MKWLLAGLTMCLLISLLLAAVTDGARRHCLPLLASLGQAASRARGEEWAILSPQSGRTPRFRVHGDNARWQFGLEKWRWRIRIAISGGSDRIATADISSKPAMPTSVSGDFQGSVNPREQCTHLVSFAPQTRLGRSRGPWRRWACRSAARACPRRCPSSPQAVASG